MDLQRMFEDMVERSAARMETGDFMQEGLLHCVKCHTPKECRVEYPKGNIRIVGCICQHVADEMRRKGVIS